MIKAKTKELKPGDIIAEHILNPEGQVLLAAGTTLSEKTISLLALWGVREIRLREEKDTDDDLRLSLQFDEIIAKNSQLFDKIKTIAETEPTEITSIFNEKSSQQYGDISHKFSKILLDLKESKDITSLTVIANIICKYATTTTGVLAYTLQREITAARHENLINHSMSVAIISAKIAKLLGYSEDATHTIVLGALIHDIGKIQLPDNIFSKEDCKSLEEQSLYQGHVQAGYDLVKSLGLPREATLILLHHHEYQDGSGFPLHLTAAKIHPYAQIVGYANLFDSLLHEKDTTPNFFAIRTKLTQEGATKFDTAIIDIFDHYLESFDFNLNVELNDGRKAEIIYNHPFFMSLVVRTDNGQFIDLSKNKDVFIAKLTL
ncbi:HD-GYP domain-containing protein [Pelosinus sp. UFO1]|uniref:HD-GYP domain-containing protein n=1 Tax=Pelosinus sp. UFO1 TaxID=484770 RepID=UPI0004D11DD8|nr:HD domain-containing phosphohydrolase [Pelosinus sp. UFO1]AIF50538.1 metal dependent phosphohydrolase [Pelosinus sp. UFO1]